MRRPVVGVIGNAHRIENRFAVQMVGERNLRAVADSVLARAQREAEGEGLEVVTHAREGEPASVLLEVAQEHDADLIVVGVRGLTGFQRFLLGSVSSKLAHHAHCSLMIVREN